MPKSSPALGRPGFTAALVALLLVATTITGTWLARRTVRDRAVAAALADAMTAPRVVFDTRSFDARFDAAVSDLAYAHRTSESAIRGALERFASGGWPGQKRAGYDVFLAQLASRRFELAITSIGQLANAARNQPQPGLPAWRLLALHGILEFGRGRAATAEPALQQAFDLANRTGQLDTPEAASLHTAIGSLHLSRGQRVLAEPYLRRAASILRQTEDADLRDRARVLTHFAQSIAAQGFPEEAEPLCSEALKLAAEFRRTTGRPDTDYATFEENYRKLLRDRGLAEAEIEKQVRATR